MPLFLFMVFFLPVLLCLPPFLLLFFRAPTLMFTLMNESQWITRLILSRADHWLIVSTASTVYMDTNKMSSARSLFVPLTVHFPPLWRSVCFIFSIIIIIFYGPGRNALR